MSSGSRVALAMKYVMWEGSLVSGDESSPVFNFMLFPECVVHSEVAQRMQASECFGRHPCEFEPVSAGFLIVDGDGRIAIGGRSESLKLDSHPDDARIIESMGYAHGMGFPSRKKGASSDAKKT